MQSKGGNVEIQLKAASSLIKTGLQLDIYFSDTSRSQGSPVNDQTKRILLMEEVVFIVMNPAGEIDGVTAAGLIRTFGAIGMLFVSG